MKYEIIQQADREAAHQVLDALAADINALSQADYNVRLSNVTINLLHRFDGPRAIGSAELKIRLTRTAGKVG